MWNNPALLKNIADALFAFSMLAALYGAGHYVVHQPGLFPLDSVRLDTAPQRVVAEEVQSVVSSEVRGNLFTVDIDRLRLSLEKLPWVRSVSVHREFPHGLAVRLEEHQALARWNGHALVNQQGEVFAAESEQTLPEFTGPEGTSLVVSQYYEQFSQQLAPLGLQVSQAALSPRHAWQLRLSNGITLELGREEMQQRLARFVTVYPYSLAATQESIKYVDLRYRNGFAVGSAIKS